MKKFVVPFLIAAMMVLTAAPASASYARGMKVCMQGNLGTYDTVREAADMCTNGYTPRP